jgi:hypothetical protein
VEEGVDDKPGQYIVTPQTLIESDKSGVEDLLTFLNLVEQRADMSVLQIVGTRDEPQRLKISATETELAPFRSQFADRLIIEPDRPLELF